ncbi:MAG: YdcF family protein [Planctomycetota bacterium]|nr:YdcF family protein [Planctomycetota bacterium]
MLREILPLFLMPTFVVLALLAVALRTRRRWPLVVALALLWAASTPVVSNVLMRAVEDWRVRQVTSDAPNADAIVVLSFGIRDVPGDATSFEFDDFDRFLGGFDLYKAGKAPRLIFTGGWSGWKPNMPLVGDVLISRARDFGIPASALSTTGKASNTEQEALGVAELLSVSPPHLAPRILLVTSAYHMSRAEMLFRRAGLEVIPFPVDFQTKIGITPRSFIPNSDTLKQTDSALKEIYGRMYYWIVGG